MQYCFGSLWSLLWPYDTAIKKKTIKRAAVISMVFTPCLSTERIICTVAATELYYTITELGASARLGARARRSSARSHTLLPVPLASPGIRIGNRSRDPIALTDHEEERASLAPRGYSLHKERQVNSVCRHVVILTAAYKINPL